MPGDAALDIRIHARRFPAPHGGVREVLRDVAFTAREGEILALFGPSGTGKSTVLRIVAGLDRGFDGTTRLPPRRIGAVFQEPRLAPWLSVADNLRLVAGEGAAPDIPALLAELGLEDVFGLRPAQISLGMARRVALARALAVEPGLLLLDEPFASLDPALAARLAGVILAHARRLRATVLLATHELDQAMALADRILVLAGQPATLAADLAVPDRADAAASAEFRAALRKRFPFLSAAGGGA